MFKVILESNVKKRGVYGMSKVVNIQMQDSREAEILNTFAILLPQMTEIEQEKLLAFGEGMVLMSGIMRSEKNAV